MTSTTPHLQPVPKGPYLGNPEEPPTIDGGSDGPPGDDPTKRAAARPRTSHALPTDRVKFEKQTDALSVYAQLGAGGRPVNADDLGKGLELTGSTASLLGAFFRDSGWLERAGRGTYRPTSELVSYKRHLDNLPEQISQAKNYLATAARRSWYWETIEPLLEHGSASAGLVRIRLASAADADQREAQLDLVLEWLEWLGLITRSGADIKLAAPSAVSEPAVDTDPLQTDPQRVSQGDQQIDRGAGGREPAGDVAALKDAVFSFELKVRLTAEDARTLSTEQVAKLLELVQALRPAT